MSDPTADPYRRPADPFAGQSETQPMPPAPPTSTPPTSTPPASTPPASTPPASTPPATSPAYPPTAPQPQQYPPTTGQGYDYQQPTYPPTEYPQTGYPPPGYAQPGYGQPGYAQPGYGQPGAYGVDPMTGMPLSDKSKVVAGVLQLVLGAFGAGRFYTGHTGMAVAQIAVTWLTCGIGAIWPLVDGILILVQPNQTDAQGRVLRS